MKKKPKLYEDEPPPNYLSLGSYGGFNPVPEDDERVKPIIGFIRPKKKRKKKNENREAD